MFGIETLTNPGIENGVGFRMGTLILHYTGIESGMDDSIINSKATGT